MFDCDVDTIAGRNVIVPGVLGCYSDYIWVNDVDVGWVREDCVELGRSVFHLILAV